MEKTTEAKTEPIVVQQETVVTPPVNTTEVDYIKLLADKDAELTKVTTEKDNYRRGMLKAKGKLPDEESDETPSKNWREEAREIAREELLATQQSKLQAEKDALINEALRQNKELQTALRNRGQIGASTGSGSNQDKVEVKIDTVLSPEQLNSLKAKGWDDKKIEDFKKNLSRPLMPTK